jgi:hypothetical protein
MAEAAVPVRPLKRVNEGRVTRAFPGMNAGAMEKPRREIVARFKESKRLWQTDYAPVGGWVRIGAISAEAVASEPSW